MKKPTVVSLFTEKGQTDIVEIVTTIFIVIVIAYAGWVILGAFGLQPPIIPLITVIIVIAVIGFVVYLFLFTDVFASEEVKRRKREELQKKIEEMKREQELKRSILRKRLIKERGDELEGLTEEEKEYLLKKWIEEEEEKELERIFPELGVRKPEIEKVPPLSAKEKERLIQIVGTRCCYPNCRETLALDVHHIIPRAEGGTNKENNLIVLCPNHHRLARGGTIPRERLRQYSVAKVKRIR